MVRGRVRVRVKVRVSISLSIRGTVTVRAMVKGSCTFCSSCRVAISNWLNPFNMQYGEVDPEPNPR